MRCIRLGVGAYSWATGRVWMQLVQLRRLVVMPVGTQYSKLGLWNCDAGQPYSTSGH
jgi:hypothetical protein